MAQTMKVKKGDIVHILRGKDAGKEGRVLEALPKQGRVVVENINVVKRHRRPRPIQNTTGLGGGGMTPGGIIDLAAARLERDGRLSDLWQADPRRDDREDGQGPEHPRSDLQEVRGGDRPGMSAVADTYTPRLKEQYENEIRPRLKEELGLDSIMQAPRIEKITLNMGVGEAKTESKLLDSAIEELTTIAGQRA